MALYPVSLCLQDRLCVVIGAGDVALRKIEALQRAEAAIKVVAPGGLSIDGVEHINRLYRYGDLEGAFLVIAATDDNTVNEAIYKEARERNILINVVDNPGLCTFYVPSVVNRGDLQIGISTGGKCPALAKRIRRQLEALFGAEYEAYLNLIEEVRIKITKKCAPEERKGRINKILNDMEIMEMIREGRISDAEKRAGDYCQ